LYNLFIKLVLFGSSIFEQFAELPFFRGILVYSTGLSTGLLTVDVEKSVAVTVFCCKFYLLKDILNPLS
jgi:hypothetical protein